MMAIIVICLFLSYDITVIAPAVQMWISSQRMCISDF